MKKLIYAAILLSCVIARADQVPTSVETWTIDGKVYTSKAEAIRHIVSAGKRVNVQHTRCEILTNKLSFKACPKNKVSAFENEQFESIHATK